MSDVSRECFRVLIDIKYLHGCAFMVVRSSQLQVLQASCRLPRGSIYYQQGQLGANEQEILCIIERSERLNTAATRLLPISGSNQQYLSSCPQRSSWDKHLPSPSRTGLIRLAITTKYPHASSHADVTALTTYPAVSHRPNNRLGRMADS